MSELLDEIEDDPIDEEVKLKEEPRREGFMRESPGIKSWEVGEA